MKHEVFAADELEPGGVRAVEVGGIRIAVARTPDGEFHALRDRCSHSGAKLSIGWLQPFLVSAKAGDFEDSGKFTLRCPWHGYEFDLESGVCPADPKRNRVKVYAVTVEDGKVFIER